ncbi:MAG TPA: serine/threonine-protein kinase [Vicinamibacteria bacterium]|nr:serine/threonine-protein kinase [Vicinamibacteria bacterium]
MAGPGSTIGRYEILREIGRGAMGVVYEARDPALDRTVALKVIQPSAEGEAARVYEERFLAEARIAAALQHPGIVVVHDVGRDPATGTLFIALELVRGQTLAHLAAAGPFDWRTALQLVAQVARALHHAHRQGVVHRDVKPANVMVLPTGEAKVMDFGIARLESARQRLTTTGEFIGTPLYTAPEQAKTEDVDGRADVFSLASVAYTLLTGRAAFMAPTIPGIVHRVVYEEPHAISRLIRGIPADVERVLARALAKDPEQRYPTAEAFAEDAEDVLAGQPPRHAGGDDLVVVEESDSPLAELLVNAAPESSSVPAAAGATRSLLPADLPRRRRRGRAPALAAVAAGLGLLALFLWAPWRAPGAPSPPATRAPTPEPPAPTAPTTPLFGPLGGLLPETPARLRIDFDHPLRSGTLRVFVDDALALEEPLTGQKRTKGLVFGVHGGSSRNELETSPGLHEVRVEVRWDENVRTQRIVGNFRSGATRRLEVSLGRIRRDLNLEWK